MELESIYSVVKLRRNGGQYNAFLVQKGVPLVLPSLWIRETVINCKANTVEAYLRDVKLLYEWGASEHQDLNKLFRNEEAFNLGLIRSLAEHLCQTKSGANASSATCNRRKESVCKFIEFSFHYHIHHKDFSLNEQFQAEKIAWRIIKKLEKFITFQINSSPPSTSSSELNNRELSIVEQIISPGSANNPYKGKAQQIRNYCMYRVTIETLARRGEIVLMEIDDVELGDYPTITIKAPSETNSSRRKDGASLKTKGRTVPISFELKDILAEYIESYRTTLLVPRRPCTALFVSTKDGRRLSAYTINIILNKIAVAANTLGLNTRLHPHGLRATGANKAREKLAQSTSLDGVEMTEALSYMGGWVQGSAMVQHYTKRVMSEQLGRALRDKAKTAKPEE